MESQFRPHLKIYKAYVEIGALAITNRSDHDRIRLTVNCYKTPGGEFTVR